MSLEYEKFMSLEYEKVMSIEYVFKAHILLCHSTLGSSTFWDLYRELSRSKHVFNAICAEVLIK